MFTLYSSLSTAGPSLIHRLVLVTSLIYRLVLVTSLIHLLVIQVTSLI